MPAFVYVWKIDSSYDLLLYSSTLLLPGSHVNYLSPSITEFFFPSFPVPCFLLILQINRVILPEESLR